MNNNEAKATFLVLGKGVTRSALIREAEVAVSGKSKKKGEAWKSTDYDQILDDMGKECLEICDGAFDQWIVEVEATEEEVDMATRFDPSVIRWQRVRPAYSQEAFLAIRKELREAGLIEPTCREESPCRYSTNGATTKERSPGIVAQTVAKLARDHDVDLSCYNQGLFRPYPCPESWCGNWPRTERSLRQEGETHATFWGLVFQLRKKGVLA